jgi:hypothetical protein
MGFQESTTKIFEKFTWKIENFSGLNAEKIYSKIHSEPFILGGYPWYVIQMNELTFLTGGYSSLFICSLTPFVSYFLCFMLFRKINLVQRGNQNNLSIYLEAVKTANMSEGWSRDVVYKLVVFNQLNTNRKITKGIFLFPLLMI